MDNQKELNPAEMEQISGGHSTEHYTKKYIEKSSSEYVKYFRGGRCPNCKRRTLDNNSCYPCHIEWIVME